jgi:pimeloyl-ACP methyl ester carboxylesterase
MPSIALIRFSSLKRLFAALGAASLLALLAACGDDDKPARGEVLEISDVATLPKSAIDQSTAASGLQTLSGQAQCDVSLQQVVYRTVGPRGENDVQASAALLVPGGPGCVGPFPLVAYTKGTDLIRSRTLANASDPETGLLIGMLAAHGYAVVATDYIGFARSDYPYHPYLDAQSEAASNLDAIRAARAALQDRGVDASAGVFLTGYSQGGHASMATQEAIEKDAGGDVRVAAAGHSSGPYDLTGSFLAGQQLLPAGTSGSSVFVPYMVTGFQKTYGNLYSSASDYFKPPYDAWVEGLLPGAATLPQLFLTGRLPLALGDLITERMLVDVQNPATGLRQAFDRNSLLGWAPRAPTLLCGGARDPVVGFANALRARESFAAVGSTVSVVDVEQVPAFAMQFPSVLTIEQLAAYHGNTVPPLCLKIVRDQLFAGVRLAGRLSAPLSERVAR